MIRGVSPYTHTWWHHWISLVSAVVKGKRFPEGKVAYKSRSVEHVDGRGQWCFIFPLQKMARTARHYHTCPVSHRAQLPVGVLNVMQPVHRDAGGPPTSRNTCLVLIESCLSQLQQSQTRAGFPLCAVQIARFCLLCRCDSGSSGYFTKNSCQENLELASVADIVVPWASSAAFSAWQPGCQVYVCLPFTCREWQAAIQFRSLAFWFLLLTEFAL